MGTWELLRFSLEIGPGLYLLAPYDRSKIPVLFVHGINGSPLDWRSVIQNLDRSRFQALVLSYASGLPLHANAEYLYNAVTQLRHKHGFDNLYLVAHSMGGLVSQGFIDRYRKSGGRYLKVFVSISTPWAGHAAAGLALDFAPAVVPVWRDMAPASKYLAAVRQSRLPAGVPYHLLFSYRGGGFPSSTANDGSVTVASQLDPAAQDRALRIYGFDTGHTGMLSDQAAIRLVNKMLREAQSGGAHEK